MAFEIKAPDRFILATRPWIFLGGTIDMGASENWQAKTVQQLSDYPGTILNPRRDDWDSSWVQNMESDQFVEQVQWELEAQEQADLLAFVFLAGSQSPITLLELGLAVAQESNVVVYCPTGYWRFGNVEIICARYGLVHCLTIDSFDRTLRCRYVELSLGGKVAPLPGVEEPVSESV